MNYENEYSHSGNKLNKRKTKYKKLNIKKNLQIMNDPAFHLNRTLKAYINNKLNKNNSTDNIKVKNSGEIKISNEFLNLTKYNDNNSFNRIKTVSNIINKKHFFSNKKINKLKKHSSKSRKKLMKSISTNKFNLSNYILLYNKSINNDNINKDKILKKNSNNSQKCKRYSGSTALSINDTNQLQEKNNSILPYNNNQLLSNHSTLDFNNLKSPNVGQTTSKKNRFSTQYYQNLNDRYKHSNYSNAKNKKHNYKNINLIKNRQNLTKNYINNNVKNTFNDKNTIGNYSNYNVNIFNKTESNINHIKKKDNYKDRNTSKSKHNIRYSYNLSNNKNDTPKNNNSINISSNLNKQNNIDSNNKIKNQNYNINEKKDINNKNNIDYNNNYNNTDNNNNNNEYIKKIEMLEIENKILKGEINDSKNKLLLLESKINELLKEKNSIEKDECPQPTPYVKKYSLEYFNNFALPTLSINNNDEGQQREKEKGNLLYNNKLETDNNKQNNKGYFNQIQKNVNQVKIKINMQKQKLLHLNTTKSNFKLKEKKNIDTPKKINVNKNIRNIINNYKKDKRKTSKNK